MVLDKLGRARKIKSPIRYVGSKTSVIEGLLDYYPENVKEYREPFIGGGSMLLGYLSNKERPSIIKIGDLNYDICILWDSIIYQPEELIIESISLIDRIIAEGTADEVLNPFGESGIKAAAIELVANRCRMFGNTGAIYYNERTKKGLLKMQLELRDKLESITKILRGVGVRHDSFEWALEEDGEDVLVVLDPPYYRVAAKDGYYLNHKQFDFEELRRQLLKTKHKFIMTLDDSEYTDRLREDFNVIEYDIMYRMANKIKKECLIYNF